MVQIGKEFLEQNVKGIENLVSNCEIHCSCNLYNSKNKYKHIKTETIYTVIDDSVINCNDSVQKKHGTRLEVLYVNDKGQKFVQNREDFHKKFEKI